MNKFGIENLKRLILFACDFTKQMATALEDGKFGWQDSFGFIDEVAQIPALAKSFNAIKLELSELSPEERQELYDYLKTEFDIPNDAVEVMIENSLSFAISAIGLFEQWKSIKK